MNYFGPWDVKYARKKEVQSQKLLIQFNLAGGCLKLQKEEIITESVTERIHVIRSSQSASGREKRKSPSQFQLFLFNLSLENTEQHQREFTGCKLKKLLKVRVKCLWSRVASSILNYKVESSIGL